MGNFNRSGQNSGGGFNRGFGGATRHPARGESRRFDGKDGGRPTMFKAICSECGDECQLPFRPNGERPVFCSNCFAKQNDEDGGRPNRFNDDRRARPERPRFEDRQMHDAVCVTCGKNCQVPFRPTAGKPIFCEGCFDRSSNERPAKNSGEIMDQFKILNNKIDKLIQFLTPTTPVEKEKNDKPVKEKKIKTKIATKKISVKKKK